jgi:hypothetical protein
MSAHETASAGARQEHVTDERALALLGVPAGQGRVLLAHAEAQALLFICSRFAVRLAPRLAELALHSLLLFHGSTRPWLDRWDAFDANGYVAWLCAQNAIHPAAVSELYRAWRAALAFSVEQRILRAHEADAVFAALCALERPLLLLSMDGHRPVTLHEDEGDAPQA